MQICIHFRSSGWVRDRRQAQAHPMWNIHNFSVRVQCGELDVHFSLSHALHEPTLACQLHSLQSKMYEDTRRSGLCAPRNSCTFVIICVAALSSCCFGVRAHHRYSRAAHEPTQYSLLQSIYIVLSHSCGLFLLVLSDTVSPAQSLRNQLNMMAEHLYPFKTMRPKVAAITASRDHFTVCASEMRIGAHRTEPLPLITSESVQRMREIESVLQLQ